MKNILKFLTLIILLLNFSCASVKLNYNRKKIYELEKSGYKIYFDSKEIKSDNLHISKQKINSVKNDCKNKIIEILPNEKVKMINGEYLLKEMKYSQNKDYELIIINGIPYEKAELKNALIDLNSISEVTILKYENANKLFDRQFKEDILIVKTSK